MSLRKHYMTLCVRGNTEVTHILKGNTLEITFEQAKKGGFNTLVLDDKANIISNQGFNNSDIVFFKDFLLRNIQVMYEEARGEL